MKIDEEVEMFRSRIVTALRPRICSSCYRTINTGDRFEYTVEVDQYGVRRTSKLCMYHDLEGNPIMTSLEDYAASLYGEAPEGDEDPHASQAVPDPGDSPSYNGWNS